MKKLFIGLMIFYTAIKAANFEPLAQAIIGSPLNNILQNCASQNKALADFQADASKFFSQKDDLDNNFQLFFGSLNSVVQNPSQWFVMIEEQYPVTNTVYDIGNGLRKISGNPICKIVTFKALSWEKVPSFIQEAGFNLPAQFEGYSFYAYVYLNASTNRFFEKSDPVGALVAEKKADAPHDSIPLTQLSDTLKTRNFHAPRDLHALNTTLQTRTTDTQLVRKPILILYVRNDVWLNPPTWKNLPQAVCNIKAQKPSIPPIVAESLTQLANTLRVIDLMVAP